MSVICSPNFQFTFSSFDKVTYVTGSYRLTPQRTECKHFLKDSAFNSLQDMICLQNSLEGEQTHSQPSVYISKADHCFAFKISPWEITTIASKEEQDLPLTGQNIIRIKI